MVFIGLIIEKEAEDVKAHGGNLTDDEKRFIHKKAEIGWLVLMVGIGMEIVLGGGIAAHDVWESNKMANAIEKNSPEKQPITSLSAFVSCEFVCPFDGRPSFVKISPSEAQGFVGELRFSNSRNKGQRPFFIATSDATVARKAYSNSRETMDLRFESPQLGKEAPGVDLSHLATGSLRASEMLGKKVEVINGIDSVDLALWIDCSNSLHAPLQFSGNIYLRANNTVKFFTITNQQVEEGQRMFKFTNSPAK